MSRNPDADCSECDDRGVVRSSRWWDEDADPEPCPRRGCSAAQRLGPPCVLCAQRCDDDAPCTRCADCNATLCRDCGDADLRDWLCPQCVADARKVRIHGAGRTECSE